MSKQIIKKDENGRRYIEAEVTLGEFLAEKAVWDYHLEVVAEGPKSAGADINIVEVCYLVPAPDALLVPADPGEFAAWKREHLIHKRAVYRAPAPFPFTETEEHEGLNRMKMIGGSFARAIATAWFAADLVNREKLRSEFTDLLRPYVVLYREGH